MMASGMMLIFSAYLAQAAGAALLSVVFLVLYRFYRQRYLMDWAWSFWAGSMAFSGGAVAIAIMRDFAPTSPARMAASYFSLVMGYLQLVWLLSGAYDSDGLRQASRRVVRTALWAVPSLAVLLGIFLPIAIKLPEVPLLTRQVVSGAAYLVSAGWVLRGWRGDRFLGRALVASALGLLGLASLHTAVAHLVVFMISVRPGYLDYVPYLSILLQYLVGLGVVMSLLEAERARALMTSRQMERLAYYDGLTGLPNRELLMQRLSHILARALDSHTRPALVCFDLDRFKTVNESMGYRAGDALLVAVSQRLRSVIGPGDTLARLSGDEFAVFLPDTRTEEEARTAVLRVRDAFRAPFVLQSEAIAVTASLGAGVYPDGGTDAQSLLKSAGTALNAAAERGGGAVEFFTPSLKLRVRERLSLEQSLQAALAKEEFVLFYQPLLSADTGAVVAGEALIRWRHPERGVLGPAEFLSAAEAYGLADSLDLWVLKTACAQGRLWFETLGRHLAVAVNLSARPFQNPDLVARISHVLEETRFDAGSLELEITETMAMQDPQASRGVLMALKRLGVRIAIDDFGTGFSSLGTLHSLPVDTLKMDQSFVHSMDRDPKSAAIADAIILLAHGLGLRVVAEGVETAQQQAAVKRQGCDLIQGFLISYPLPALQFERYLRDQEQVAAGHGGR